jgi:hypothetical protein
MLVGVVSALGWFGLFLAMQLAGFRWFDVRHRSKLIAQLLVGAVAGHLATVGWIWITWGTVHNFSPPSSAACGVLLLLCLFILYMPFFYTLTTSLSVETLSMLEAAPRHRLPLEQVKDRFTSEAFVVDRLETMRANGYFVGSNSTGYTLTNRGKRVADAFTKVKIALALGTGG